MHPLLLLVATSWLLPASLGRGMRASPHPTSVSEQEPPERHDKPRLRRGEQQYCDDGYCFNCDLFDCFHRTSNECNKELYNICEPDHIKDLLRQHAPSATPTTRPPTVAKRPLVLEKSSHPVIVSLGGLPRGWQAAHPRLMDEVKMTVRPFALRRLMKCKEEWDLDADITGVSLVPGRIPGRPASVLFKVRTSAEVSGFADVFQFYIETCMERGRGDLSKRLKALDPNVFDNLLLSTGSFDPRDVNNDPTPSPTEAAETFPLEAIPVVPAPQFDEGNGNNLIMWLIGLTASLILLVLCCLMAWWCAKKRRDAAEVEAMKTAMMIRGAPGGASSGRCRHKPKHVYVPTQRKSSHPRASKSRHVEANKRRNEAGGKKKRTRAAEKSTSNLKATSESFQIVPYHPRTLQRPDPPGTGRPDPPGDGVLRSTEIVPYRPPQTLQHSSTEIVPYHPIPRQQRQQRTRSKSIPNRDEDSMLGLGFWMT